MNITYRMAVIDDTDAVTDLSILLYNGVFNKSTHDYEELFQANEDDLRNDKMAMFLAFYGDEAVGFSHAALRSDYVEGTNGGLVGYLEGVFVRSDYRGRGIAKTLVVMCENWAKKNGCFEFASDCLLENADSLAFHLKIGFTEANRIICFTKKL